MSAQLKHKVPGSDAMVSITAHVPEDAVSAGLLGTERIGHGARIRDDGLIATIGYVVQEAEHVWIGTRSTVVPGFVIGYDFDSGFALVKPTLPTTVELVIMAAALGVLMFTIVRGLGINESSRFVSYLLFVAFGATDRRRATPTG